MLVIGTPDDTFPLHHYWTPSGGNKWVCAVQVRCRLRHPVQQRRRCQVRLAEAVEAPVGKVLRGPNDGILRTVSGGILRLA